MPYVRRTTKAKPKRSTKRVGMRRKVVRKVASKTLKTQIKRVVMATKELQHTLPTSLLPITDTVATRTVSGYVVNPIGSPRIGKAYPLVSLGTQFPSDGSGPHAFQGRDFQLLRMKFAIGLALNYQAIYSKWRIMLVKLGERTDPIFKGQGTQPFNLEDVYPDSAMTSSVNYARMWPKPIGTFNPKYGTVVFSKLLNLKYLQKDYQGGKDRTGFTNRGDDGAMTTTGTNSIQNTSTTIASVIDTSTNARNQIVSAYQIYQHNVYFDIPFNKLIKDYTFSADVPNTIPRYSFFLFEEEQSGRPIDFKAAPAVYVEEIQTYTQFKDV